MLACFAMEKEAPTDADLGSYEGKYPKDLFNKTVIVNEQAMGRVAKETDDQIVVFSDSGNLRFDIPKSKITLSGGSIVVGSRLNSMQLIKMRQCLRVEALDHLLKKYCKRQVMSLQQVRNIVRWRACSSDRREETIDS